MSIQATPRAAAHIEKYLQKRGRGIGVRVGTKTTGCSGMAYVIEYSDQNQ